CTNDTDNKAYESTEYTGEEIFRGLLLLDSDFTDEIPSLTKVSKDLEEFTSANPELAAERAAFNLEIIELIQTLDEEYFVNFGNQMYSEDYNEIILALENATTIVLTAGIGSKKYGSSFKILEQMKEAGVDFGSKAFTDLDLNNEKDLELFEDWLAKEYDLNVFPDSEAGVAIPVLAVAAVVLFAYAVAINTAGVINLALAYNITNTSTISGGGGGPGPEPIDAYNSKNIIGNRYQQILAKEIAHALNTSRQ
ncbi:MAG: hypothetical protein AAF765_03755, partial [Bacteroidota bacterium]